MIRPLVPSRRRSGQKSAELAIVLLVLGDYGRVERGLAETLRSIEVEDRPYDLVLAFDGPGWRTCPLVQQISHRFEVAASVTIEPRADHPAVLANQALGYVETPYVTFLWPGARHDPLLAYGVLKALKDAEDAGLAFCRGKATPGAGFRSDWLGLIHYGHLQIADLVSLHGTIFDTGRVKEVGGFDPDPRFQRFPGWELTVRMARQCSIVHVPPRVARAEADPDATPTPPTRARWEWDEFPFARTLPAARDEVHHALVRDDRTGGLAPVPPSAPLSVAEAHRPIRVTVVGGVWEPAHNQLCFYNYFETPPGRADFLWKAVFDFEAGDSDLAESDLVILSRPRHENVRAILDVCEERRIPTLSMIDDNWFVVARDWPQYKAIFSPGRPDYEMFLEALRRSTATVVYNPVLRKHVERYARRVFELDVNIRLDHFGRSFVSDSDRDPDRPFLVGYAGTPRVDDAAFVGLSQFLELHPECRGLFFGMTIPEPLEPLVRSGRVTFAKYTSYLVYARTISGLAPDVLLAPLDDSEFTRSKCYNKFLEITACGATGIYSELEPYTRVVEHGRTGAFVPRADNERADAWRWALEDLYQDRRRCREMHRQALTLVGERFETSRRYADFLEMVRWLVGRGSVG